MKKLLLVVDMLGILILVGVGTIFYQKNLAQKRKLEQEQAILTKIKNSYAPLVFTTKQKKLYQKIENKYCEIGSIEVGTILELEKKDVSGIDDVYYPIKNSKYYIDYQDIEEVKDVSQKMELPFYLATSRIKTIPTHLYQNDKEMIFLNEELIFDVLMKEEEKYYVNFLGNTYYIKDNYQLEEIDGIEFLKEISVFHFNQTISLEQLMEILNYFQENHYENISMIDFERWITGKIHLTNNKVLLVIDPDLDDSKKQMMERYGYPINVPLSGMNFISGDTKLKIGDTRYFQYEVDRNTTFTRIKEMLNGIKDNNTSTKVTVLNYHFFYDSSMGENCNESICLDIKQFREQLSYLKENHYKILTMQEFNDWMDKKITLPEKSVLITVDDGAMGTSAINGNKLIPILEEYQIPATLFLITGWWDVANYQSPYLEIHSHGDELHHNNYCNSSGKCGVKGLLLSKEELKIDLQTSIAKIGSNLAFCFPFYQSSNTMVEALKETGFQLAFVGGNRKVKQTDNKYTVPRYVVYKNTSLASFIKMVSPS